MDPEWSDDVNAGKAGSDLALAGIFIPRQLALRKLEAGGRRRSRPSSREAEGIGTGDALEVSGHLEDCRRSFEVIATA